MSLKRKRPCSENEIVIDDHNTVISTYDVVSSESDGKKENMNDDEDLLLTPHMKRLLKLLEEGTASHAQLAAVHLKELSVCVSPLVLWDLLGRLYQMMMRQSWSSRQHAQWAMEGVANALPPCHQQEFLSQTLPEETRMLWLTVKDLNIDIVLEKGRLLLKSSSERYHQQEDQWVHQLDPNDSNFVERRLRMQRHILANRLGLIDLVRATRNVDEWLPDEILPEDFNIPTSTTTMTTTTAAADNQKVDLNSSNCFSDLIKSSSTTITTTTASQSTTTVETPNSIRALLVMEMRKQETTTATAFTSHKNPQSLLATELLYRMFDPEWHIRHGALLGIISLLRAWRKTTRGSHSTIMTEKGIAPMEPYVSFGAWPQDILSRCLCLLALDRFVDYSGGTIQDGEDAVVAPVRLVAAQAVALLYAMAPDSVQRSCRDHIMTLVSYPHSWDVRHGGWVTIQFLFVVCPPSNHPNSKIDDGNTDDDIMRRAWDAIQDTADDVVAVAAHVLLIVARTRNKYPPCIRSLWSALLRSESSSMSSAVPLLRLITVTIQNHRQLPIPGDEICRTLYKFLDAPSISIHVSTLHTIAAIIKYIANDVPSTSLQQEFTRIILKIFDSFLCGYPHVDRLHVLNQLSLARQEAWTELMHLASKVITNKREICVDILFRLIQLDSSIDFLTEHHDLAKLHLSCRATSQLFQSLEVHDYLVFAIMGLLPSPWKRHSELAYMIFRYIQCKDDSNQNAMTECINAMQEILETNTLVCDDAVKSNLSVLQESAQTKFRKAFTIFMRCHIWNSNDPIATLKTFMKMSKESSYIITPRSKVDNMRITALLSGALVSRGIPGLPSTLTPLVRALMTSIKSEADPSRIEITCSDVVALLRELPSLGKGDVYDKIVSNICNLIPNSDLPNSNTAAVRVLETLVSDIPIDGTVNILAPVAKRLRFLENPNLASVKSSDLQESLNMLVVVAKSVRHGSKSASHLISSMTQALILIASVSSDSLNRISALTCIKSFAKADSLLTLDTSIPYLVEHLQNKAIDSFRLGAVKLLCSMIEEMDVEVCPFVRYLLPITMSLMTDPVLACAKEASKTFACLVCVAPFVKEVATVNWKWQLDDHSKAVMDHLIHGKPLPTCDFPQAVSSEMKTTGTVLRVYQSEGISWLRFLQSVGLSGALCDSMGLGKTLQALVAVALLHEDLRTSESMPTTLVVCPSSVVGHWVAEIKKFFPTILTPLAVVGNSKQRSTILRLSKNGNANVVVTSYSVLRSDVKNLKEPLWAYCILDEGHLLKNPKTATALAARQIKARHRLILTGTPLQNRVMELWATFDFLMPNFLGSHAQFVKEFATPIQKVQNPGASPDAIAKGMDKLKLLHQQVLPFLLRREKDQVLKELPAKSIMNIPCFLTEEQRSLYETCCIGQDAKMFISDLQSAVVESNDVSSFRVRSNTFKSLLNLRLLCTHPILVESHSLSVLSPKSQYQRSGKLQALNDLLRTAGVGPEEISGADNDTSIFYVNTDSGNVDENEDDDDDGFSSTFQGTVESTPFLHDAQEENPKTVEGPKCLIFAQFTCSLDVVEKFLFQEHMPSLRYLRLDGKTPNHERSVIVEKFNNDPSIHVLLLTTRVGGLGLNLTGASMVVFLEHDFNPFVDLQAMDRAHRIGQTKVVNIYRLVTSGTIEEKIMEIQESKIRVCNEIVNAENSSMFSLGTDKLLDIFTLRSDDDNKGKGEDGKLSEFHDLDDQEEEYHAMSVEAFVKGFQIG